MLTGANSVAVLMLIKHEAKLTYKENYDHEKQFTAVFSKPNFKTNVENSSSLLEEIIYIEKNSFPASWILKACFAIKTEQPDKVIHRKIIIPAHLKPLFLQQLLTMNVTARSLIQSLDGTGKSLGDLATLKVALYTGCVGKSIS